MPLVATWIKRPGKTEIAPNPSFPLGRDMVLQKVPGAKMCGTPLKYPAPGLGYWALKCNTCGLTAIITAAGRADDPRHVKVQCKLS